jgi:5'-phosphate synthase pdxT subunit
MLESGNNPPEAESDMTSASGNRPIRIGVLAMQGAFIEHCRMMEKLGCECRQVRKPEDLEGLHGLIIPGGESTTIGKLMDKFKLFSALQEKVRQGLPVYGTCAGLILLAKEITGSTQPRLGFMDISVQRNGYGRQIDSFEADLSAPLLGDNPFHAVFIRAPFIEKAGPEVEVLAELDKRPVLARQGKMLVSSFHPELTDDLRIHELFLQMVKNSEFVQLR